MNAGAATKAVEQLTGSSVRAVRPISGSIYRVDLADGSVVVAKQHGGIGAAEAEAASLRWLREPGVTPVPKVFGCGAHWLVTEWIRPGPPSADAAEAFGRGLAQLHLAGASAFGAAPPEGSTLAWIGPAPMRNEQAGSWEEFFVRDRIEPYLRTALDSGALTPAQARPITAVCDHIESLAGPAEPPARVHGDLWSGNVHWAADGRAWLIDPAAHGGHRETDVATLHLFGCPELDRLIAAYHEQFPLADGWRGRVPLHQLFLLLVHVVLFGGGYAASAVSSARAALRG
jgi:fructosamine-3-kinase